MRRASRQLLREIEHELQRLERSRDAVDREISRLRQAAAGVRQRQAAGAARSTQSLTNACRAALRSQSEGLSPREVRAHLTAHGFDWSGFSSPLSAIHTVLKRLVAQDEALARVDHVGRKRFHWKPRPPLAGLLTQAEEAARIEHLLDGAVSNEEFAALLARWREAARPTVVRARRKDTGRLRSRRP
jgi:hypothetical protein